MSGWVYIYVSYSEVSTINVRVYVYMSWVGRICYIVYDLEDLASVAHLVRCLHVAHTHVDPISRCTNHITPLRSSSKSDLKSGEKYTVKLKNSRRGFTCTICQTLMDTQRRASVASKREEIAYKLK